MTGEIVWLPKAKEDLKQIIRYIKQDSPQNAIKVKTEVLQKISDLLRSCLKTIQHNSYCG
jgi:plasmid stabilization system protein ParE